MIELIVAVGVFTVVMVIAAGALLSVVSANQRSRAQQSVMNNLNFALEGMVREIRVGTTYHCGSAGTLSEPQSCAGTGSETFAFEDSSGNDADPNDQVVYRLQGESIERSLDSGNTWAAITAPEVVIENLAFFVTGAEVSDGIQPKLLMIIQGNAGARDRDRVDFNLQTLVSQRLPEF